MIYLHIGKAKTGTTTIQGTLYANRISLAQMGYLYPNKCIMARGHHNIYFELTKDERFNPALGSFNELLNEIENYKRKNKDGHIILSSETFEALSIDALFFVYEALSKLDEVRIVILLRRQDRYLLSYWAMQIKSLKISSPFEEWSVEQINIDNDENNEFSYGLDYHKFINSILEKVDVSKIMVTSYAEQIKGGLVENFLQMCGIKSANLAKYHSLNTPLCPLGLEVSRQFTKRYGTKLSPKRKKVLGNCIQVLSKRNEWDKLWKGKEHLISNEIYQVIKEEYQASNGAIAVQYPSLYEPLQFEERILEDQVLSMDSIPREDLLDLAIFTFSAKEQP